MRRVMIGPESCVDADVVCSVRVIDPVGDDSQIFLEVSVPSHVVGATLTRTQVVRVLLPLGFEELAAAQERL